MSKRHQSNRRRTYGRRQHELHERRDRVWAVLDELEDGREPQLAGADVAVRELGLPAYGMAYLAVD